MATKDLSTPLYEALSPVKTFLYADQTVEKAAIHIREISTTAERKSGKLVENIVYFYVVNKDNKLVGVVSARDLLRELSHKKIADLMETKIAFCYETDTLEKAMEVLHTHRLLALPVVDKDNTLVGSIDVRNYIPESQEFESTRFTEDVFQLFGVTLEEGKRGGAIKRFSRRMPWILCNMAGGIFCALISTIYEDVLKDTILLAMFIPLVLTLAESISMQSMTQSLQALRKSSKGIRKVIQESLMEWKTVFLLALFSGILVGVLSLAWAEESSMKVAMSIGGGLIMGITVSGIIGSAIPYLLHARKLDPKVAAGPVVLMFADVITTGVYLAFSTWLLLS